MLGGLRSAALCLQVHVGEVEAEKAQLQLLRATLTSKLELKDQQLAEMQAAVVVGKHACT